MVDATITHVGAEVVGDDANVDVKEEDDTLIDYCTDNEYDLMSDSDNNFWWYACMIICTLYYFLNV